MWWMKNQQIRGRDYCGTQHSYSEAPHVRFVLIIIGIMNKPKAHVFKGLVTCGVTILGSCRNLRSRLRERTLGCQGVLTRGGEPGSPPHSPLLLGLWSKQSYTQAQRNWATWSCTELLIWSRIILSSLTVFLRFCLLQSWKTNTVVFRGDMTRLTLDQFVPSKVIYRIPKSLVP